jgi:RNA polymerase sigma factor (sigma-70 family)
MAQKNTRGRDPAFEQFDAFIQLLKSVAIAQWRKERPTQSLQTTLLLDDVLEQKKTKIGEWAELSTEKFRTVPDADKRKIIAFARTCIKYRILHYVEKRDAEKRNAGVKPLSYDSDNVDLERDEVVEVEDLGEQLDFGELTETVLAALEELPEEFRNVIQCRFFEELTIKETAEKLGVSASTVKARQASAIKALFDKLTEGIND